MAVRRSRRQKRSELLAQVAHRLDLDFTEVDQSHLIAMLRDFRLFRRGSSRKIYHVMSRRDVLAGLKIWLFDYHYTVSSGKSSATYRQSVMFVHSTDLGLPGFFMRPEQIIDKIGSWLGIRDINFEQHPDFSRQYYLKGPDEELIRSTFTEPILHFFTVEKDWFLEGLNYYLILYQERRLQPPEQLEKMYVKGLELYELLRGQGYSI